MANLKEVLSEDKIKEIQTFLLARFDYFEKLRKPLDDDIKEEIDLYNDIDEDQEDKEDWQEKLGLPYIYTIVQTIVARVRQAVFSGQNYLRIYLEDTRFSKIEKDLEKWGQNLLDKIRFKSRARDFIEDGLVERTNWLELVPMKEGGKFRMDFDVHTWNNVWFDTKVLDVEDTDIFVRKIQRLYKILANDKVYFNMEDVKKTTPPDDIKEKQKYEAKQGQTYYYDPSKNNSTDQIELLEWHGDYDLGDNPDELDIRPVIFVLGNREKLIRAETVELETKKKKLLFPIRPIKQAKSLIAKSIPQLIKNMAKEVNEMKALRLQNFKALVKLLFKYNRNADLDYNEIFSDGGNMIGWIDSPEDIDTFNVPNMIGPATLMITDEINSMQQTTGAVDPVIGAGGGRGNETASGIRTVTEQALFKISMISENVHDDVLPFVKYYFIFNLKEDRENILKKYPGFTAFIDQEWDELENSDAFDIAMKDLTVRRDVERSQFINVSNVILPLLERTGGNFKEYLRQVMESFDMENIDEILTTPPEEERFITQLTTIMKQNPQVAQVIRAIMQNPKLAGQIAGGQQGTPKQSQPEEEALNEVPEKL
jgi:hypothetical protein